MLQLLFSCRIYIASHHNNIMTGMRLLLLTVFSFGFLHPASACLWDDDTLAMEQAKFPGILELIAGNFPRHSPAYYEWKIQDRLKQIEADPEHKSSYDDLAVAYEKAGNIDQGLHWLKLKNQKWPDEYKTHANLGTLLIHKGELKTGLKYIERAIQINPDAHFGREKYQALLVQFLIKQKDASPPKSSPYFPVEESSSFLAQLVTSPHTSQSKENTQEEIEDAIKGVSGMMRFGRYNSPVLLEAMGDLMDTSDRMEGKASRLAGIAYLQASRQMETPEATEAFRELAKHSISIQRDSTFKPGLLFRKLIKAENTSIEGLKKILNEEIQKAEKLQQQIAEDEARWIAENKKVDVLFREKYF